MRYFLEVAYRGTNYSGWQVQPNANSVQAEIVKAMTKVMGLPVDIVGSGRTDTGVHCLQQFAHFDTEAIPGQRTLYAINALLPHDIAIKGIYEAAPDAHARFSATSRAYEYHIHRHKNPFKQGLSYHFRHELDVEAMNRACMLLMQHTDFESFSRVRTQVHTFNCTIYSAAWEVTGADELVFKISANRFLRGMVRAITGTLLLVGEHRLEAEAINAIIEGRDRKLAGRAVPPDGLFLSAVTYPDNCTLKKLVW